MNYYYSKEFAEGRDHGYRESMFDNKNPYIPGTEEFEDWEAGFKKGSQEREWL
jgi:hypothetical protein